MPIVVMWTYVFIKRIYYSLRIGAHLADICAKKNLADSIHMYLCMQSWSFI